MKVISTENKSEEWQRMCASISFIGILIVIGVPLWWKTTEVYRVSLPYNKINSLDENVSYKLATNLTILAADSATSKEVAASFRKVFREIDDIILNIKIIEMDHELIKAMSAVSDELEAIELIKQMFDTNVKNHMFIVEFTKTGKVWIGGDRVILFKDSSSTPELVRVLTEWILNMESIAGAKMSRIGDLWRRIRMPLANTYDITLTVVNPSPDILHVEFDAQQAIQDYVGTFIDELSDLHNFTLKTQWIYLLNFDFKANKVSDTNDYGYHMSIQKSRLSHMLSELEKRMSHVSNNPNIHLVLYTNPCDKSPIYIYDDDRRSSAGVEAFISPKWGGVIISNPTYNECKEQLTVDDLKPAVHRPNMIDVMGTFVSQLRTLIGIADVNPIFGAELNELISVEPRQWEVDTIMRIRTLEQITSAKLTLQSIAQLLGEIPNIVINDEVGASIHLAIDNIDMAGNHLDMGDILKAYQCSKTAFLASEAAFVDPSLLALLYFPDDQKYAVYIPLFLPVMIPVVISLKNVFIWIRGNSQNKCKID